MAILFQPTSRYHKEDPASTGSSCLFFEAAPQKPGSFFLTEPTARWQPTPAKRPRLARAASAGQCFCLIYPPNVVARAVLVLSSTEMRPVFLILFCLRSCGIFCFNFKPQAEQAPFYLPHIIFISTLLPSKSFVLRASTVPLLAGAGAVWSRAR